MTQRDIHPDWLASAPGTPPSPRPQGPSDAERAYWWRTRLPSETDINAWLCQVEFDITTARWERAKYLDYRSPTLPARMIVLPADAFTHPSAQRAVANLCDVPTAWNPPNPAGAWAAGFAKPLSGHAEPWRRNTLRASLKRNELPSREDQIVCNRVLRDLDLPRWLRIAVEERWTIGRLAAITRNAGSSNPELCTWLNQHADLSFCPALNPPPAPETAVETWNRCWLQPIVHATSGPHGDLSCYEWQTRSIHH